MNNNKAQPLACETALEWIHLLLDDALAAEQKEKLAAHVQTCAHCRALQQELLRIEAAHAALDARTLAPPENYFADLPERVLARIAEEEQPAPIAARVFERKPERFNLWNLIWGRGRYAFAFVAMLALAFIVTRELRESEGPQTIRMKVAPPSESELQPALQISKAAPPKDSSASSLRRALPSAEYQTARSSNITNEEEMVQSAEVTAPEAKSATPISRADYDELRALAVMIPRDTLLPSLQAAGQAFATTEYEGKAQALTRQALTRQAEPPVSLPERAAAPRSRMLRSSTDLESATTTPQAGSDAFGDILTHTARVANEAERIKIWQRYLRFDQNDSSLYNAKVENIAHLLAAEVDSSATAVKMREALIFYQTMKPVLVSRWGVEKFELEKARWEGLLNWKTARRD